MVALPNPSFEPETHRWRPGAWAPSREVPSQNCAFCAPKHPFLAQNGPKTHSKRPNEGKRLLHSMCGLTSPCQRASSAFQLHDMSEKGPKKAPTSPKICAMCTNTPKPSTGRILGYVAQNPILRAPSPPATPHFLVVSKPQNHPTRRLVPPYLWSLGAAGGQPGPRTAGANGRSTGVPGAKKRIFSKLFLDHLGCSNKCF